MKTDAQLQCDVMAELGWEPSVDAAHIGVDVDGGIVTLTGQVGSHAEKLAAEQAAQCVSGVMGVAVGLRVEMPADNERDDADIARAASNVLHWMTFFPRDNVRVAVENGCVTLSGEVDWAYQRDAAAQAVRFLMGVNAVSNQITIKPGIAPAAIKLEIEAALQRRALDETQTLKVDVHGTDVTLTGTVQSWPERELIRDCAWRAAGVSQVTDHLVVRR